MDDKRRRLGERLRNIRQSKRMTQEELAEKVGLHPTHIAKMEAGDRSPSLATVERLATALGVQPSFVVGAMDEDSPSTTPHSPVSEGQFSPDKRNALMNEVLGLLEDCNPRQLVFVRDFIAMLHRYV
ncbi:MAG: helix-turn-helix domain-containing protein [Ignavibacteriales bacterium]